MEDVNIQTRENNYKQENEPKSKEPSMSETQPLEIPTTEASL